MKIMYIVNRITKKTIVAPPIDKDLLVARHPQMIHFFSQKEQINILSRLWWQHKLSTAQCIELNPAMNWVIDDIISTCNME